jgi:hypothetical protein
MELRNASALGDNVAFLECFLYNENGEAGGDGVEMGLSGGEGEGVFFLLLVIGMLLFTFLEIG